MMLSATALGPTLRQALLKLSAPPATDNTILIPFFLSVNPSLTNVLKLDNPSTVTAPLDCTFTKA